MARAESVSSPAPQSAPGVPQGSGMLRGPAGPGLLPRGGVRLRALVLIR